jgi:hypothetical protein
MGQMLSIHFQYTQTFATGAAPAPCVEGSVSAAAAAAAAAAGSMSLYWCGGPHLVLVLLVRTASAAAAAAGSYWSAPLLLQQLLLGPTAPHESTGPHLSALLVRTWCSY